jgi:hypothetical protein
VTANSIEEVRALIDVRWQRFRAAIGRLSANRLAEPTSPGWTARESTAHIAFWDEAAYGFMLLTYFNEPLPDGWTFGSGWLPGDEPWPHFEIHNAREAEWARQHTDQEVLERLDRAHHQLLALLPRLTPELVQEKREHLAEISQHYVAHLPELEPAANTKPA